MKLPPFSERLTRRQLLKAGAAAGAGSLLWPRTSARAEDLQVVAPEDRKLLFVVCAWGGASIIDSYLPVVDTEVGDPALASRLNVFPERLVEQHPGSNIRSVKLLDDYAYYAKPLVGPGYLIERHGQDMVVVAHDVGSVNHTVGQQRSLNGAGVANSGRTLMEAMAMRYGGDMPLPNCNMAIDGYTQHGVDDGVPTQARHEIVSTPELFAAGTHGYKGLLGVPPEALIQRARSIRQDLDANSPFGTTFAKSVRLQRYLGLRSSDTKRLEQANLIEQLLLFDPAQVGPEYGLAQSPLAAELRQTFPRMDEDNFQAQIALGFLMAYYGISTSVALGLRTDALLGTQNALETPALAFDASHNGHRVAQSMMWSRLSGQISALIDLLKAYDYMGEPALGKMWDRSLIYVATEFGRGKDRPQDSDRWGSSHDLNNGSVLLSPLLRGNSVFGGVNAQTGMTFGYDRDTGAPNPNVVFKEQDVYGLIAHAMDIQYAGRSDHPQIVR